MLIDAAVHPSVAHSDDIREFMEMPWRKRVFSPINRYAYSNPFDEYFAPARPGDGTPGSSVELAEAHLFDEGGVDFAVLLPLTRGMNMDTDVSSAVCRATNAWLAETWLGAGNAHGRFKGSIRVNPDDPSGAVEEIARWAGNPHMVQVGVPMASFAPYGNERFFPVWEAAAKAGLPIAVHIDGGSGVEFPTSPVGNFRTHVEFSTYGAFRFAYHLSSLITHGVFDRLEDLVFIFADGGVDLAMPMVWRLIADWRSNTDDHPWARNYPPTYLGDHIRFVYSRMEGPTDPARWERWLQVGRGEELLVYGSHYPFWNYAPAATLPAEVEGDVRERILAGNALSVYRRLAPERAATH